MIGYPQVEELFSTTRVPREEQMIQFEISFLPRKPNPEFYGPTLVLPVWPGDSISDIDLRMIEKRKVWIEYDRNDPDAVCKAKDLAGAIRFTPYRCINAMFLDRLDHLRVFDPAGGAGWKDATPTYNRKDFIP